MKTPVYFRDIDKNSTVYNDMLATIERDPVLAKAHENGEDIAVGEYRAEKDYAAA